MNTSNIEQMKLQAQEMSEYYFKGFEFALNTLNVVAKSHLINPNSEKIRICNDMYLKIHEPYSKINVEHLEDNVDVLKIIPEVKRTIKDMGPEMEDFFKNPVINKLYTLDDRIEYVSDLGNVYGNTFKKLVSDIRSKSEIKEFKISVYDIIHEKKFYI